MLSAIVVVVAIAVWFTKGMLFIVGRVLIGQQMIMANGANKQKKEVKAVQQRQRLDATIRFGFKKKVVVDEVLNYNYTLP